MGSSHTRGRWRLRPGARPGGRPGQVHGRAGLRGACGDPSPRGPCSGLAAATSSCSPPPVCHYRRRLQGIYWGQGLLTGTRSPQLALKKEKWPRIPLLGSPFKATGTLSQGTNCPRRYGGGGGREIISHGLMGAVRYPRTPHCSSAPHLLPHRCPTALDSSQMHLQDHSYIPKSLMKNPKFTHCTRTYSILSTQISRRNADKHMHMHITHNNTATWAHTSPTAMGTPCENTDRGHGTDTALHGTHSSLAHTQTHGWAPTAVTRTDRHTASTTGMLNTLTKVQVDT